MRSHRRLIAAMRRAENKEEGSFLKKRTKKLLSRWAVPQALPAPRHWPLQVTGKKSFCFFFFRKRRVLLCVLL
jgi:hypothetical protein